MQCDLFVALALIDFDRKPFCTADNSVMRAFFVTKLVLCIIFIADLILGSVFSFQYMFGTRWWMDFVSALSMVPLEDLSWASTQIEWLGTNDWLNYLLDSEALQTTKLLKMVRLCWTVMPMSILG